MIGCLYIVILRCMSDLFSRRCLSIPCAEISVKPLWRFPFSYPTNVATADWIRDFLRAALGIHMRLRYNRVNLESDNIVARRSISMETLHVTGVD
jgi:hypothetical protein